MSITFVHPLTFRFRRQHEQLRQVIVRVLRPATQPARPGSPTGDDAEAKPDAVALDAADANAIEEVNLAYENVKEVDGLDVSKEGTDAWDAAVKRCANRCTEHVQMVKFVKNLLHRKKRTWPG